MKLNSPAIDALLLSHLSLLQHARTSHFRPCSRGLERESQQACRCFSCNACKLVQRSNPLRYSTISIEITPSHGATRLLSACARLLRLTSLPNLIPLYHSPYLSTEVAAHCYALYLLQTRPRENSLESLRRVLPSSMGHKEKPRLISSHDRLNFCCFCASIAVSPTLLSVCSVFHCHFHCSLICARFLSLGSSHANHPGLLFLFSAAFAANRVN